MAKKKKKKRPARRASVFPVLYPSSIGTPFTYAPGSGNDSGGQPTMPAAPPAAEGKRVTRASVIEGMRRALGLVEYFSGDAPHPAIGGYSLPSFAAVAATRAGGPSITGPGFQGDGSGVGGVYNFKKSPGLGFRSEAAWRIWEMVMKIIDENPSLPKHSILLRAMAKSGIHRGQIDPAEYRLLEMGVEWYLSDAGALGAKRNVFY